MQLRCIKIKKRHTQTKIRENGLNVSFSYHSLLPHYVTRYDDISEYNFYNRSALLTVYGGIIDYHLPLLPSDFFRRCMFVLYW